MTLSEDLLDTLNWILDTPRADPNSLNPPELRVPWRLEIFDSHEFMADLPPPSEEFVIRVSSSVWPCLETFGACAIDWNANGREPRARAFDYSAEEWEAIIRLTNDCPDWSAIEPAVASLMEKSRSRKRIRVPLSLHVANGLKTHSAAAYYGFLWLVCHEGTHAWKRHYELVHAGPRESLQARSELLAGGELHRTYESEADWESTRLLYAHVLECALAGYGSALAFAAGFGAAAALLLLGPCLQDIWDRAVDYDPGWMRLQFVQDAPKAGYWMIAESRYPEYVRQVRRFGAAAALRYDPKTRAPSARFLKVSDETRKLFSLGLHHAMRFAQAIGDANEPRRIAGRGAFKFGEPGDWKEFQIMVMGTDILGVRRRARAELRRLLPADTRFQNAGPLGFGASLKLAYLAAARKRRHAGLA